RRSAGVALSTCQTRGAHDRREERHRRIARCPVLEGVAIQTDLSRPLGHPPRNVTAAQRAAEQRSTNVEDRRLKPKKLPHRSRKQLFFLLFVKLHGFDEFSRMRFA